MRACRTLLMLAVSLSLGGLSPVSAMQTTLTLPELGVSEELIVLPTRNAARELRFTRPRNWHASAPAVLTLTLQHSDQLDPKRSHLDILLNDRVLKTMALTPENTTATTVSVPLPEQGLLDVNRLTLRVEQHLPNRCEDPLDKALWTQILPNLTLRLQGDSTLPVLDFAQFPAPLVDSLAFTHLPIDYEVNGLPSDDDLTALLRLQSRLVQTIAQGAVHHTAPLPVSVSNTTALPPRAAHHQILLGSAYGWDALQVEGGVLRYSKNGWTWQTGSITKPLNDATGVLAMRPNPASPKTSLQLLISGNSPKAVLRAVDYLLSGDLPTLRPDAAGKIAMITPEQWQPSRSTSDRVAYLKSGTTTFAQLGLQTVGVEKITAPPITQALPNVYRLTPDRQKAVLNAVFSYGPGLNPRYSSVEFRLNDRSLGSAPLNNPKGASHQTLSVPIPVELMGVRNRLVTQFHLAPDKYGFCVDDYVDNSWAKLHADSAIQLDGVQETVLPNLAALLPGPAFPASSEADFAHLTFAVFKPDASRLSMLLTLADKLGRQLPKGVTPAFDARVIATPSDLLSLSQTRQLILVSTGEQTDTILETFKASLKTDHGSPSGISTMRWQSLPSFPVRLMTQTENAPQHWLTVVSAGSDAELSRLTQWLAQPEVTLPESEMALGSGEQPVLSEGVFLGKASHHANTEPKDFWAKFVDVLGNGWQRAMTTVSSWF